MQTETRSMASVCHDMSDFSDQPIVFTKWLKSANFRQTKLSSLAIGRLAYLADYKKIRRGFMFECLGRVLFILESAL